MTEPSGLPARARRRRARHGAPENVEQLVDLALDRRRPPRPRRRDGRRAFRQGRGGPCRPDAEHARARPAPMGCAGVHRPFGGTRGRHRHGNRHSRGRRPSTRAPRASACEPYRELIVEAFGADVPRRGVTGRQQVVVDLRRSRRQRRRSDSSSRPRDRPARWTTSATKPARRGIASPGHPGARRRSGSGGGLGDTADPRRARLPRHLLAREPGGTQRGAVGVRVRWDDDVPVGLGRTGRCAISRRGAWHVERAARLLPPLPDP